MGDLQNFKHVIQTMKNQISVFIPLSLATGLCAVLLGPGCSDMKKQMTGRDVVTQVSSYDALALGLYDGVASLEILRPHGNFGLGTLHGWNGEIILMDGKYYLVDGEGRGEGITDFSATTPFLEMTWFDEDERRTLPDMTSYQQFRTTPEVFLPSVNAIVAVRIEGKFRSVKACSMPTQTKPYKVMSELVKTQPVFDFEDVEGTLVGFWSPPSMKGVSLAGWHLHFLTKDGKGGGHVLEFTSHEAIM
jgi:acetolactate decarboxylase